MTPFQSWRQLEGTVLDGRVRIGPMLEANGGALYLAEGLQGSDLPAEVAVRLMREKPEDGPLLERYLEAIYLDHPNLLRCYAAGVFETPNSRYTYAVLDRFEDSLKHRIRQGPPAIGEVRELGVCLAEALRYLHQRNLVCCSLDVSTVVRGDRHWQIADYSQLRVAGGKYANETRRLLASSPSVPPEAFEGVVTPAWDVWSLASVIIGALSAPRGASPDCARPQPRREYPEPFATVIAECLASDPSRRCSVERLQEILGRPEPVAPAISPSPSAASGSLEVAPTITSVDVPNVDVAPAARAASEALPERAPQAETPPSARTAPEPKPPLETRFRVLHQPPPPRRKWTGWAAAGGALAAGALIGALTMHPISTNAGHKQAPQPVGQVEEKPSPSVPDAAQQDDSTAYRSAPATDDAAQVRTVLDQWIAAARARDISRQAQYYAPRIDAYYGAKNVSRDWVRHNREQTLQRVGEIRELSIRNVQVQVDRPGHAVATFDKTWDFAPQFAGQVRQQLILRKTDGGWKIVSERDTRVYRSQSAGGLRRSARTSL